MRNKPRVFLSHSKHDIEFINRVYEDLRKCQIDPWRDDMEIRHGKPWLDTIFESGIPTCDAVLVYLTPNSIESEMVKKEIDASLIKQLRDKHMSFLPYVSQASLRTQLRSDLQTLQTLEWNNDNYDNLLPCVVAEIWHGFMDRTIIVATSEEKLRRLELESEMEKLKGREGIFSSGEDGDFRNIWNILNRWETVEFHQIGKKPDGERGSFKMEARVNVRSVLPFLASPEDYEHNYMSLHTLLIEYVFPNLRNKRIPLTEEEVEVKCNDLSEELLMFGFIERRERPQPPNQVSITRTLFPALYTCVYTQKFERFKYWLTVNNEKPEKIEWRIPNTTRKLGN